MTMQADPQATAQTDTRPPETLLDAITQDIDGPMDEFQDDLESDNDQPEPIRAIKVAVDGEMKHTLTVETIASYQDYARHVEGMIEPVRLIVPSRTLDGLIIPVSRAHARSIYHHDLDTYNNTTNPSFIMWVNEEYLYKFPVQRWNFTGVGTAIWCGRADLNTQGILGNVLFTGDAGPDGETRPIPEKAEEIVRLAHKTTEELLQGEEVLNTFRKLDELDNLFHDGE